MPSFHRFAFLAVLLSPLTGWVAPALAQQPVVYRVPVTGTIELGISPFIKRSLEEAEKAGARAVVLDVNTLGGRVDAALEIVDAISAAKVPVYAFVHPRAISAGALISVATDSIFMTPDAVLGASTVVGAEGEKVSEKAQSAMRAQYRALAERRGLDPRVGEAMVDEDIAVPGLTEKGKLLTLTAQEAQRVGYAIQVKDFDDMLTRAGIVNPKIVESKTNWAEALVRFLTNPIVASILLPLGLIALYAEIKTPGLGAAGAVGALALALFFGSHFLVGLAGWEEVILFVIGVVFICLEIFVFPGFGIAGVIGMLSIGASLVLALLGDFSTSTDVNRALGMVSLSLLLTIVAIVLIVKYLPRSHKNTFGIFLNDSTDRESGFIAGVQRTDLVGAEGRTVTDLRPAGVAEFGKERVDVVSDAGYVARGRAVQVVRAEPYRNVVIPVEDETTSTTFNSQED